jgi:hypothetical protein
MIAGPLCVIVCFAFLQAAVSLLRAKDKQLDLNAVRLKAAAALEERVHVSYTHKSRSCMCVDHLQHFTESVVDERCLLC